MKQDLSAGEFGTLVVLLTALVKALTELVKIMKRRERADLSLLSDLED